jgi:multidrug efflux pump subunit AcrA (membrane-fusion protein)
VRTPDRGHRRRNLIIAAATVVVIGTILGVWLGTGSSASSSPLVVTNQVVSVTSGTMKQTVSASGTIEPASTADLNFGVSGTVTSVNVVTGEKVTAGQVLATVDPSALQVDVGSAQASLTSAEDKLSTDRSDDAVASQIDSDEASVTTAQTDLTTAQTDLADANLTSTIAGTVASVSLAVGQQVTGSSNASSSGASSAASTGSGATGAVGASSAAGSSGSTSSSSSSAQITVISTDSYTVSTTVDDTQVGEVKVGDQAVITPEDSATSVYGTVTSVGLVASSSSTVSSFPVSIAVTGSPSGLYAGSTATVSIITKEITDAVEVPTAAISYSGGKAMVTAVVDGSHVARSVTTGEVSDGDTQITSGLTVGDKVVERVVKFNASAAGGGRSLFGGSSSGGSTGGFPGGGSGPPSGGFGGAGGAGGGFGG